MLHDGDRAGENDIGVDETAELHGVELSAELQPEALPADHARHAEQRQRQKVERVVAAQNARGNGRYIIHGEVGLRVGEIALAAVRGGKVIDRHDRPADGKQSPQTPASRPQTTVTTGVTRMAAFFSVSSR